MASWLKVKPVALHLLGHQSMHMPSSLHRATASRQLSISTYKVVPFSPISGLVEWVQVRVVAEPG